MKESVGLSATINIIMIFLVVAFIFLVAIISYAKAFKAASIVVKEIERFEGYNQSSFNFIDGGLATLGYATGNGNKCEATRKSNNMTGNLVRINDVANGLNEKYEYCIYYFNNDGDEKHYSYGVITYMTIDLYMFDMRLRLPVYVRTRRIYRFG